MAKRPASKKATSKPRRKGKDAPRPGRGSTWNTPVIPPPPAIPSGDHPIELIARGVWLHGSRVLLCQDIEKGYYYLPGGHIEFGESAAVACEREFLEECGQKVVARELVLVSEGTFKPKKRWHHEVNLVFSVRGQSAAGDKPPTVKSRESHLAFAWVDLAAAVDLDIRPMAVKAWLAAGAPMPGGAEWVSEIAR